MGGNPYCNTVPGDFPLPKCPSYDLACVQLIHKNYTTLAQDVYDDACVAWNGLNADLGDCQSEALGSYIECVTNCNGEVECYLACRATLDSERAVCQETFDIDEAALEASVAADIAALRAAVAEAIKLCCNEAPSK